MTKCACVDGKRLLGRANESNDSVIWDTDTGQILARLRHNDRVEEVRFSRDLRRLVTASDDYTARVWDTRWLALHGEELIAAVCREKLDGGKLLTSRDIQLAPILRGREGEDVCVSHAWLDSLKVLLRHPFY